MAAGPAAIRTLDSRRAPAYDDAPMNAHKLSLLRAALAAACLCAAIAPARGDDKDVAFLLDGVGRIAAPGAPGPLCVFGDKAMPVVTGKSGENLREAVVAATRLGAGRAVAFGHDG